VSLYLFSKELKMSEEEFWSSTPKKIYLLSLGLSGNKKEEKGDWLKLAKYMRR